MDVLEQFSMFYLIRNVRDAYSWFVQFTGQSSLEMFLVQTKHWHAGLLFNGWFCLVIEALKNSMKPTTLTKSENNINFQATEKYRPHGWILNTIKIGEQF